MNFRKIFLLLTCFILITLATVSCNKTSNDPSSSSNGEQLDPSVPVGTVISVKYSSREQNSMIAGVYRKRMRGSFWRMILVSLLALGVLFLELATAESSLHND